MTEHPDATDWRNRAVAAEQRTAEALEGTAHMRDAYQSLVDNHEALIDHANAMADVLERWSAWLGRVSADGWRDAERLAADGIAARAHFAAWMMDGGK